MSGTYIGTDSVLKEKLYRAGLIHEAERQALAMGFVSKDDDSGIVLMEDTSRKRGDSVQVRFSPTNDDHDGFGDNAQIEGNEESIALHYDEFKIDYLALSQGQQSAMSQQRVSIDLKKAAFVKLGVKWARRFNQSIWHQLAGYTPAMGASQNNYKRTGMNPVTALDTDHVWRPTGVSADESLSNIASNVISLDIINELLFKASSKSQLDYPMLPCSDGYYHFVMHTKCWQQLRENTSAGDWGDIHRAILEGGKSYDSSAHARGFLGVYGQVKLHVDDYIPNGVNSSAAQTAVTTVRRCLFIGARAAHIGFGNGYTDGMHLDWVEQTRDYRKWGVVADSIFGVKRFTPTNPDDSTSQTYGVIAVPVWTGV